MPYDTTPATLRQRALRIATSAAWRRRASTLSLVVLAHWLLLEGLPRAVPTPWGSGEAAHSGASRSHVFVNLAPARAPTATVRSLTAGAKPSPRRPPAADQNPPDTGATQRDPADEEFFGVAGMLDEDAALVWALPAPVLLQYEIRGDVAGRVYATTGQLRWQHDGTSYQANMDVGDFHAGARTETSTGSLTANGLAPLRFTDSLHATAAAEFDHEAGTLDFGAAAPLAELKPGAQDRLSVLLQLAAIFAGNADRLPAGSQLAFPTVGVESWSRWVFTVGDSELLTLLEGPPTHGIHLSRPPADGDDTTLDVWLAPSIGYMPLRIRLSRSNGDAIEQLWRASATP